MTSERRDDPNEFRIIGVIEEAETGRPLPNLVVRAFDRDLIFDDKIGYTNTNDDGHFESRRAFDSAVMVSSISPFAERRSSS